MQIAVEYESGRVGWKYVVWNGMKNRVAVESLTRERGLIKYSRPRHDKGRARAGRTVSLRVATRSVRDGIY